MTAVFVYRNSGGGLVRWRRPLTDIPRPDEPITEKQKRVTFRDLIIPSPQAIKRTVEELLDRVVIEDSKVTRGEDQLDQLCHMLLLKLHSDKKSKLKFTDPPVFRPLESVARTGEEIRREFKDLEVSELSAEGGKLDRTPAKSRLLSS